MLCEISKELKATRIRKGFSIDEVAQHFNLSYETIRKYETGKTNITVEFIEKLLDLYEVESFYFFRNLCENMHKKE